MSGQANLPAQGLWERRAPYPIAATEVSGAALNGHVYVVCGLVPGRSVSSLYRYDPRTDAWTQLASAPIDGGADHCNVAAANGRLYLLGAIRVGTAFVEGNTYEYDPAADRWQRVAQMNTPRGASGVAVISNRIYVAGGLANGRSVATVEVFDPATRTWTNLPDMPTPRDHLTAQAVNGRLYAIAGRNTRDLTANEEFDPATSQWRARAPIPTARGGLGSGTLNGRIQVFGGEGNSGTPQNTFRQNEEYDLSTDTWRALAPLPTPRHGLNGITLEGRIFAPSGGPTAGAFYSDVHEAFYLPGTRPQLDASGIRSAASFEAAVAPGALVAVFGQNLAQGEQQATRLPLPMQLNGVTVRLNGTPLPLLYVGPGQVNVHLPYDLPASSSLTVANAGLDSAAVPLPVSAAAPALFSVDGSGRGQGAVLIGDTPILAGNVPGAPSRPVRRGETIAIFCTGLGAVDAPPGPGQPSPALPARTVLRPAVTLGGVPAEVLFSGLTPGLVGLYQVNVRVPENTPTGSTVAVRMELNADVRPSNTVTIAVE